MGATAALAAFSLEVTSAQIPDRASDAAVRSLVDSLGVALAGLAWPSSTIVAALVEREAAPGPALVIGRGFRAQPAMAALANGALLHALDFDDMSTDVGHPSAAVVPAALAVAEAVGASGRQLIDAIVIGVEISARLGRAAGGVGHPFHTTPICGVFGAAAAAARLLGLDVDQLRCAFGIAASEAGGVRANFGTHAKPYHAGECNRAGVVAAYLARDGFVANKDVIEAKNGWADAVLHGRCDASKVTDDLGGHFALEDGVTIKEHPTCGANAQAIEAVVTLMRREHLRPEDVESIEVHQSAFTATEILAVPWPTAGLEGKFSLAYNVAEAWQRGAVTVETFTDRRLAELEPLRGKITIVAEDGHPPVRATMQLTAGRSVSCEVVTFGNHMSSTDIEAKFRANAARAGREELADEMLSIAWQVEALDGLRPLTELFE